MSASKLESDTDVSSNDSWTVLGNVSDNSSFTKLDPESNSASEEHIDMADNKANPLMILEPLLQEKSSNEETESTPSCSSPVKMQSVQKLASDKSSTQLKSNKKKYKLNNPALLSIAASFLTITGLTLFCLMFPSKTDITKSVIEKIENNYVDIMSSKDLSKENVMNTLQKTMEALDLVQEVKIIDEVAKSISNCKKSEFDNSKEKKFGCTKKDLPSPIKSEEYSKTSKNSISFEKSKRLVNPDKQNESISSSTTKELHQNNHKNQHATNKENLANNENKNTLTGQPEENITKQNSINKETKPNHFCKDTLPVTIPANEQIEVLTRKVTQPITSTGASQKVKSVTNYQTKNNINKNERQLKYPTCKKENEEQKYKFYLDKINYFTDKIPNKISVGAIARFLSDNNVHLLLTALVQDICIYKLITQICKNDNKTEEKLIKKISKIQKLSDPKKSSSRLLKKIVKQVEKKPLKQLNSLLPSAKSKSQSRISKIYGTIPCNKIISEGLLKSNTLPSSAYIEYGKSECQKRFEDLEKKWEHIGATNRQIINNIRTSFQNEMDEIKDSDPEISSRQQKIILTREKYTERLKMNREKYLKELGKLRDERQRILKQLCLSKKKLSSSCKDVSVGNYAVVIPTCYDFQQKLKALKEREVSCVFSEEYGSKALAIANPINSTPELTNKLSNSSIFNNCGSATQLQCVESEYAIDNNRDECDEIEDKILHEENKRRLSKLRQKFLRKRAKLIKKAEKSKDDNLNSNGSTSESAIDRVKSNTSNNLQKSKDLYNLLFERYAKVVKNNDSIKWNTRYNKDIFRRIIKQDSLKAKENRLIYRGSCNSTF